MPSRKQRKRRQKELRHEYEFVVVDEEGRELDVDPEQLKAQRAEKERERAQPAASDGKKPRAGTTARDARGRPLREIPPPSWGRTLKRAAAFTAVMFLALSFLAHGGSPVSRVLLTLGYGALFIPFLYLMDRMQHRQYLRRKAAAASAPAPARGARSPAKAEKNGGARRGLRRGSRT